MVMRAFAKIFQRTSTRDMFRSSSYTAMLYILKPKITTVALEDWKLRKQVMCVPDEGFISSDFLDCACRILAKNSVP